MNHAKGFMKLRRPSNGSSSNDSNDELKSYSMLSNSYSESFLDLAVLPAPPGSAAAKKAAPQWKPNTTPRSSTGKKSYISKPRSSSKEVVDRRTSIAEALEHAITPVHQREKFQLQQQRLLEAQNAASSKSSSSAKWSNLHDSEDRIISNLMQDSTPKSIRMMYQKDSARTQTTQESSQSTITTVGSQSPYVRPWQSTKSKSAETSPASPSQRKKPPSRTRSADSLRTEVMSNRKGELPPLRKKRSSSDKASSMKKSIDDAVATSTLVLSDKTPMTPQGKPSKLKMNAAEAEVSPWLKNKSNFTEGDGSTSTALATPVKTPPVKWAEKATKEHEKAIQSFGQSYTELDGINVAFSPNEINRSIEDQRALAKEMAEELADLPTSMELKRSKSWVAEERQNAALQSSLHGSKNSPHAERKSRPRMAGRRTDSSRSFVSKKPSEEYYLENRSGHNRGVGRSKSYTGEKSLGGRRSQHGRKDVDKQSMRRSRSIDGLVEMSTHSRQSVESSMNRSSHHGRSMNRSGHSRSGDHTMNRSGHSRSGDRTMNRSGHSRSGDRTMNRSGHSRSGDRSLNTSTHSVRSTDSRGRSYSPGEMKPRKAGRRPNAKSTAHRVERPGEYSTKTKRRSRSSSSGSQNGVTIHLSEQTRDKHGHTISIEVSGHLKEKKPRDSSKYSALNRRREERRKQSQSRSRSPGNESYQRKRSSSPKSRSQSPGYEKSRSPSPGYGKSRNHSPRNSPSTRSRRGSPGKEKNRKQSPRHSPSTKNRRHSPAKEKNRSQSPGHSHSSKNRRRSPHQNPKPLRRQRSVSSEITGASTASSRSKVSSKGSSKEGKRITPATTQLKSTPTKRNSRKEREMADEIACGQHLFECSFNGRSQLIDLDEWESESDVSRQRHKNRSRAEPAGLEVQKLSSHTEESAKLLKLFDSDSIKPPQSNNSMLQESNSIDVDNVISHMETLHDLEKLSNAKVQEQMKRHMDRRIEARGHLLQLMERKMSVRDFRDFYGISFQDTKKLIEHVKLCLKMDEEIRWDLVFHILLSDSI